MANAVYKKKKNKITVFTVVNYLIFVLFSLAIIMPLWKVLIDSLDAQSAYQFRFLPNKFSFTAYQIIFKQKDLIRPLINSFVTTIFGTLFGLALSTLGGYVLIQFDLPGRNFMAWFIMGTMLFSGGMIPTYLVMKQLHLINTIWIIVVLHGVNVYNLILMRNFFEGIPASLFEAARIDGCSPMGIFFKIVLPLSKAALASIGLMFAVGVWNDFTNVTIYISDKLKVNFQYKLRTMIMDAEIPALESYHISDTTLYNAGIIMAILPFMALYPFLQKYFVKGVNIGAVKE